MSIKKKHLLSTSLLTGLSVALISGAVPAVAIAQEEPQTTDVGEIIVTGSRIRRDPTNTPTPLIQIGQAELHQSGEVNVIDFLADIPALSNSMVPEDTTGTGLNDGGLSLLNLRALGTARTLTLVDGRRHVGSSPGSLAVDVDTIPRLLIENVEVITGGAAAVYGADAVSGVVNFVLKKNFDGLEIDASVAQINEDGQLGRRLSVLWGRNAFDDRLNFYVAGEYQDADEVMDSDIDWRRASWAMIENDVDPANAPNDGIPDRILIRDARTYIRGTNYGGMTILATGTRPSPSNDPDVPFQECPAGTFGAGCFSIAPDNRPDNAYIYNSAGEARAPTFGTIRQGGGFSRSVSNGGDGQVLNTEQGQNSRLPRSENYRFQSGLNFQLTDSISLFAEAKYVEEKTYDESQRVFHDFNIRALAPGQMGAVTATSAFEIGLDNAYLPEDVRQAILNNVRTVYDRQGNVIGTVADPRAQHKLYGPSRTQHNSRDLQRYVLGLRGDAGDIGFVNNVNWEIGYTYGEMNNANREVAVDILRYQAAADAVRDVAGIVNGNPNEIVCRAELLEAQGIALEDVTLGGKTYSRQGIANGCVPIRVFGEGGFSQEAMDYLGAEIEVTNKNQQHDLMGFVAGELWDFWGAGPIGAAIGYEYRKENTSGKGRDADTAGRLLFLNGSPDFKRASYDTNDLFAELRVPLLRDSALGRSADFTLAYRHSDYSHVGKQDTYSAQFQWRPVDQFMFRATAANAIRVPDLDEAYGPYTQTYANGFRDPCSVLNIQNHQDETIRKNRIANCQALANAAGLDLSFADQSAANAFNPAYGTGGISGQSGGNSELQPETSDSFTIGGVWTPDYLIPNLAVVMDYYEIEINDAIDTVTAQQAANQCVSGSALNTAACATITRDANSFMMTTFRQGALNYAAMTAKGVDFTVRYGFDLPDWGGRSWGNFSHAIRGNWLIEQNDYVNIDDPEDATINAGMALNSSGVAVGMPSFRFLSTMTWAPTDRLAFTWDWDWQASQEIEDKDVFISNPDRYATMKYLETGDFSQHDFSVRYTLNDELTIRAGVVNAFDAEPAPWLGGTVLDNFDLFGRRYFISLNFRPF